MGSESADRRYVIQQILEKMRDARFEYRRWELEAKYLLDIAAATTATADGTFSLQQAKDVLLKAEKALARFKGHVSNLHEFVIHGKLPPAE
jgi:hypothetical protein